MKRKIIKLGQATFVLSLPSKWIRENQLNKGDYVEVDEEEGILKLSSKKAKKGEKLVLDISTMNHKLANAYLEIAYTLGYDTIEVVHGPNIDIYASFTQKKEQKKKTTAFIQEVVNQKFINMEIVEQSDRRTVIKDLAAGMNTEAARNIFNRILFLLSQQANDVYCAVYENDKEKLESLYPTTLNARKFILYYSRMLSSAEFSKNETKVRANVLSHLNSINSAFKSLISQTLLQQNIHYSKNALHLLKLVNSQISLVKDAALNFSNQKAVEFLSDRESFWEKGYSKKGTAEDIPLYWCCSTIMAASWFVVKEMHGLQLMNL